MNLFYYPPPPVSNSYQEDEIWVPQHLWRALQNTHIHDLAGGLSLPPRTFSTVPSIRLPGAGAWSWFLATLGF